MKIKPYIIVPKTIKMVSHIIMQKQAKMKRSQYATDICKALQVACVCAACVVREQEDSLKAGESAQNSCSEVQSYRDVLQFCRSHSPNSVC